MTPADLLGRYAARRDAEAFAEIVRLHQRMVFATCRRNLHDPSDLDDAVQETFLRLAQKAGELKSNLAGWLYRCAANVATDINRRRASRQKHETAAARRPAQGPEDDPQRLLAELREHLDAAMKRLDPDEADLIADRFFVGRPQTELAAELGLSPSAISARVNKAVESLRRHLGTIGCAAVAAGGAAAVVSLLEAETASAIVPAALTANVVKIGLSAVPIPRPGSSAFGPLALEVLLGIAAIAVVVIGIWFSFGRQTSPQAQSVPPPVPAAQPAGITTGPESAADRSTVPPQWQTTQPAAPRAVLSGQIVDTDGKPVVGAIVTLRAQQQYGGQATTNAQGNYAILNVAESGEYYIGVKADGYLSIEPLIGTAPGVQLTNSSRARRDLVLSRGVKVQATVADANGLPLSQPVEVYADPQSGNDLGRLSHRSLADPAGQAELLLPASKTPYVIAVWPAGYAPSYALATVADSAQPQQVQLTVNQGITVHGVATCSDGKPAAGWKIQAIPGWWLANAFPGGVPIDKDGGFTLTGIHPAKYEFRIETTDNSATEIATLELPPKESPMRLNVPMASPASRVKVTGRVRFVGARPSNLTIEAMSLSADHEFYMTTLNFLTGLRRSAGVNFDEAEYTFEAISPGPYRLTFESPTLQPKTIERIQLPGDIPGVDLFAMEKPKLTGTVTVAATGEPIQHFAVRVSKYQTLGNGPDYVQDPRWLQVSDSNGRYTVELIGPGIYQAQVSVDGYAWIWSNQVQIEGGTAELNFKVTPGGSLSGGVLDPSGKPLAGAKVIPLSMARSVVERSEARFEGDAGAVATGADGRFTIEHLAGGAETVKVLAAEYAPLIVDNLKVTEGQTTDAGVMKLSVGGAVEGVVYDSDGVAASGVTLQFQDASGYNGPDDERVGRVATVVSGDGGRFRVEHLAQQVLYVNIADRGQKQGVISRAVRPADGRTARLDYGGPTALSGRLLLADKPLASKRIILSSGHRDGPVAMIGTTDADGRFVFHGAPPGRYTLFCQIGSPNSEWTPARDVQTSGQPLDLGDNTVDPGDVVFSFTADDEADLKLVRGVRIVPGQSEMTDSGEGPQPRPDAASPGTWRATNVPAGKFTAVIYPGTYKLSAPFERKAGAAETSVTVHIPHGSATLAMNTSKPAGADQSRSQVLQLRNSDNSVQFVISTDPSRPSPKVPPGIYHAIDAITRLPLDAIAPITLMENDSQELHVDWPLPTPSMAAVSFRIWTPDGILVTDANVRLLDASGAAAKNEGDSQFGPVWAVHPGTCQVMIDLPGGKSITRPIDIPAPAPRLYGTRWTEMDLVTE